MFCRGEAGRVCQLDRQCQSLIQLPQVCDEACTKCSPVVQLAKLWDEGASQGFLVPPLVRFVSGDRGYLDMTNGGPRMFINLEDHISHTTKQPNLHFEVMTPSLHAKWTNHSVVRLSCIHVQAVMRYFEENCNPRLHWGKAGWPWLEPCFDGSAHYASWCDFGCAVEVRKHVKRSSKASCVHGLKSTCCA